MLALPRVPPRFRGLIARLPMLALAGALLLAAGCGGRLKAYPEAAQPLVDRRFMEYPTGLELRTVAHGFTAATALAVGPDGMVYVADRGLRGRQARITRIDPVTGAMTEIYPVRHDYGLTRLFGRRLHFYGPVGGMVVHNGELIATGRDRDDNGIIIAFDLAEWEPQARRPERPPLRTIAGELPARGDHGLTDIAIHPLTGRLFFGLGSATNSGVVGLDNWQVGWLKRHREFRDLPLVDLKIGGYRFDTEDPAAGPLNPDKVNTSPFSPFATSYQRIPAAAKPTAAIYSVDPLGGDLRVEAHGLRHPAGLAFNQYANLYATNQGMQLRGTRPVKDDPDVIVRIPLSAGFGQGSATPPPTWFGWPDYSADLVPIIDERFQPPPALLGRTGYRELSQLIDYGETDLQVADRETLVTVNFPSLSGASGLTFVPPDAPGFELYEGMLIVALRGDRAPFATSGLPLLRPVGYRLLVVDPVRRQAADFIHSTIADPEAGPPRMYRPIDVAFAPDGSLYILDLGRMRLRDGRERYKPGSGQLYRLAPMQPEPAEADEQIEALNGRQGGD